MKDRIATIGQVRALFIVVMVVAIIEIAVFSFALDWHNQRLDRLEKDLFTLRAQIEDHTLNGHSGTNKAIIIISNGVKYQIAGDYTYTITNNQPALIVHWPHTTSTPATNYDNIHPKN